MSGTYTASTIAKWFIAWANAEDADLSNLKLQKLLYYAQGWYLARENRPLFNDEIQAWAHGPVVKDVYHSYKSAGTADLDLPATDSFRWSDVDRRTTDFLQSVWNTYGGLSAWRLRDMTHDETPWKKHFRRDERNVTIPKDELQLYFASRPSR